MSSKQFRPYTPARRYYEVADFTDLQRSNSPLRALLGKKTRTAGRNNQGRVTDINIGGGHKRRYRIIDFKRNKFNVPGKVVALEYDPNRSARIARINYLDGDRRYILAPQGLKAGATVVSGPEVDVQIGNAMPLKKIPDGAEIHNVELQIGRGGQIVRSAGSRALLAGKEGKYALVKLPSGELRKVLLDCYATIGEIGNQNHKNISLGKAGRSRWLGRRPHNRGVTKNPVDHPLGGGEGKTAGGRHPCSPNAKPAKGKKTRANKRTDKFIVKRRGKK